MMRRKLSFLSACLLSFGAASGLSAADGPVEISTAEELAAFAQSVTNSNHEVDAVLLNDIDYTGSDKVIGASTFSCGTFDGRGHRITYNLSGSRDYLGLFNNLGG
ncbi:MAG: hypothetical protein IJ253_08120, partial [Bacteroidaceae bacterium]|nr:hypothetical protein [Bacteroidaceae bacterium]